MRILVTGGTGFLGRHLVWRAVANGADVIFTGRNAAAAKDVIHHAPGPVRWQPLVHGSKDAAGLLTAASRDADAIVHCAALSAPWGRREEFHDANVAGTAEVLTACHAAGVGRLVHISTPSLYFGFRDQLNIREDSSLAPPANEYVRTKRKAEMLVHADPPPETVILRPRALFGPWDQTLLPRLLRVMERGALPIMRGGRIHIDLTYIDNAIDAIWLAMTRPLPHPLATYNVTNGEPRELLDVLAIMAHEFRLPLRTRHIPWPLVSMIASAMEKASQIGKGGEPPLTRYSAGVLAFSQTLDISALCNELGYQPRVSIDEGIHRHAMWWRGQQGRRSP